MMKRVLTLFCVLALLLGVTQAAHAYTAELTYYFHGLDGDTGALYTDPMMIMLIPYDPVEEILKPATGTDWMVFLPKDETDSSRIVGVMFEDEFFELDFSGGLARLEIPDWTTISGTIFITAADLQYPVEIESEWGIPEPGTFILVALGLLGLTGWRNYRNYKNRI